MNISKPDISSMVYKQYITLVNNKVDTAMSWLSDRGIDYVWNYWIDNHLYRLYIPCKDLILDFECYPQINNTYNYIRINHDTDMIGLLEKLFPATIIDTQDLTVWKLNQKATNHFLRSNGASPIYDKTVLRIALVKDNTIYQCVVLKGDMIIANVTKRNCAVPYGTYILLRYLNEIFGVAGITIKDNRDNSYNTTLYQLINLRVISKSPKLKIWWNPDGVKWRIKSTEENKYVPLYLTEHIIYRYGSSD